MTATVAVAIHVRGRWWSTCLIQVVGDGLGAVAMIGVQVEDLGDHGGLVGVGCELHALLAGVTSVSFGEVMQVAAVSVGARPPML
jgi:hypothetical protein